jgi:hypothetical protein
MVPGLGHSGGSCAQTSKKLQTRVQVTKTVNHYDNLSQTNGKDILKIATCFYQLAAAKISMQCNVLATEVTRASNTTPT